MLKITWLSLPLVLLLIFFTTDMTYAEEPSLERVSQPKPPAGPIHDTDLDRQKLIAQFDAFYTLSDLKHSDTLSGGSFNAVVAPTYKIKNDLMFIFMYDGNYYKKLDFYSDDIGPRERDEYIRHNFTPMLRMEIGESSRYFITPSLFYTETYNKDIKSSDWNDGLYNYRDFGAGFDFEIKELSLGNAKGTLKLGTQYYTRSYPNWESLLYLAGLGFDGDEKDYHGIIASAEYSQKRGSNRSWSAAYSLLYKMLDDMKVVNENDALTSKKQHDYIHNLDLTAWYLLNRMVQLGIDLNCNLKDSNQNYYDTLNTINPEDDVFTSDFYDYISYKITPNISYIFQAIPLTATFSYSIQKTEYTDRKAQYDNGNYKAKDQSEREQDFLLDLRYDINKKWAVLGQLQQIIFRSNNDYENVYEYNYTVSNFSVGASYEF